MKRKFFAFLLLSFILGAGTSYSQRLELRFNKEFSDDGVANKGWGGGASLTLDEFVQRVDFGLNFDYAGYRSGQNNYYEGKTNFTKFKVGLSALYVIPFKTHFFFRVGGELSYNNLKKKLSNIPNEDYAYITHKGQMLGLGAVVSLQAKLGKVVRIGINAVPSYLISLSGKTDRTNVASDYKKSMFIMQLQIGFEFRLGGSE